MGREKNSNRLFRFIEKVEQAGLAYIFALFVCFSLSYIASLVGLAPIVGAFAAGLIINPELYEKSFKEDTLKLHDSIAVLSKFFVPIFFLHMGMGVNISSLMDQEVLLIGLALTSVAILGKQACSLGVIGFKKKVSKTLVGIGMIPRGEVGLIFALMGSELILNGQPVIDKSLYASIIVMVILTTVITPPALRWCLLKQK